jgi:Kef-type K+ transport system membrane component KefB
MLTVLQICAGLVLTATLLTVVAVLGAFELGRLVTRDDEQRSVEAASAPRIRDAARPTSALGSAR